MQLPRDAPSIMGCSLLDTTIILLVSYPFKSIRIFLARGSTLVLSREVMLSFVAYVFLAVPHAIMSFKSFSRAYLASATFTFVSSIASTM